MATPLVAGVAAMVRSVNPSLTSAEVRQILHDSALDLGPEGFDGETGYGLLQIDAALEVAAESPFGYPVYHSSIQSRQSDAVSYSAEELRDLFVRTSENRTGFGGDVNAILVHLDKDEDHLSLFEGVGLSVKDRVVLIGQLPEGPLFRASVGDFSAARIEGVFLSLRASKGVLLAVPDASLSAVNGP